MMNIRIMTGVLVMSLTLAHAASMAGTDDAAAICQSCGMDASKSETEFVVQRKAGTVLHACCINCARRLKKKLGEEVVGITALDYRTREHVGATNAVYVIESKRIPKGSMMPFVFAFGARKDADEFQERYGGREVSFDDIVREIEVEKNRR